MSYFNYQSKNIYYAETVKGKTVVFYMGILHHQKCLNLFCLYMKSISG